MVTNEIKNLEIKQDLVVSGDEIIKGELKINKDLIVDKNLYIDGTIKTNNLEVIGSRALLDIETYISENIEILNNGNAGPSINIIHNDLTNDVINATNINGKSFYIDNELRIGINKNPTTELDINGSIKFNGFINNISSNTFNYISTLRENVQKQIDNNYDYLLDVILTSNSEMTTYVNTIESELSHIISTSNTNLDDEQSI